jgi:hypothetical protein
MYLIVITNPFKYFVMNRYCITLEVTSYHVSVLYSAYKFFEQGQKYTVHHDYGIEDIKVVEVMMIDR